MVVLVLLSAFQLLFSQKSWDDGVAARWDALYRVGLYPGVGIRTDKLGEYTVFAESRYFGLYGGWNNDLREKDFALDFLPTLPFPALGLMGADSWASFVLSGIANSSYGVKRGVYGVYVDNVIHPYIEKGIVWQAGAGIEVGQRIKWRFGFSKAIIGEGGDVSIGLVLMYFPLLSP